MSNLLFNEAHAQGRNGTELGGSLNQVAPRTFFQGEPLSVVLNQLFYAGLAVAVVLALFSVVRGGLQYMAGADSQDSKTAAKRRIQASVGGLVLAFGSVLILNTINPNLTDLRLKLQQIKLVRGGGVGLEGGENSIGGITSGDRPASSTATGGANSNFTSEQTKNYVAQKVKELGLSNLSPSDKAAFFPNGGTDAEWMALISAMITEESGHNPNLTYQENFKNNKGEYVISTGLLQLSYESVRNYSSWNPELANITTEDLKDPQTNIDAGLTILKRLVERDGCISCTETTASGQTVYRGGAAYWAVLRGSKVDEVKENMR